MIAAIWNRVNTKRLWMTTFTVFAFIFLSDGLIHGWYLNQTYHETPNLWRSEMEMRQFVNWLVAGQFLISFFLSFIFTKGYENKGWQEGARYGFLIGLFAASNPVSYTHLTLPTIYSV